MRRSCRWCIYFIALALAACKPAPAPVVEKKRPISGPVEEATPQPSKKTESVSQLTDAGFRLITEFEGWAARPELPDLRYSGVSWAYGYDAHQNSKATILDDWAPLPGSQPARLAATQPFYGKSAVQPTRDVHDIVIPHVVGDDVFIRVDMARVFDQCRRAMPGFDDIRPNAQSALVSLVFNRGPGMSGANRLEMRAIRDFIPSRDYEAIALNLRKMVRVWVGTEIEAGMRRRRFAEAQLVMTP